MVSPTDKVGHGKVGQGTGRAGRGRGKVGQGKVGQGKGRAGRGRGMHRLYAGVITLSERGTDWHFVCNGRPTCVAQLCLYAIQAGQQRTRLTVPEASSMS